MKLSKLWLHEWVNFSLTEKELAYQLTMAGLEVDSVNPVAGEFSKVIVAEVVSTKPHPDADRLTLCDVNTGTGPQLKVVCGASNVRSGLKVALAMIGAELPGGFKIKESKLRGELSQGMLCSTSELGLTEQSEGIMELDEDAPLGMDLRTYLRLNDSIFDIDLTPNRADCFSVLGVAREIAVLNELPLSVPPIPENKVTISEVLELKVEAPEACPRYVGRIIRQINSDAKTPLWMSEKLGRSGLRLVHPVVDVMNYVMLEFGQPMHAFDLSEIKGELIVRYSKEKEQLELLDGQNLTLNDEVLVIADTEKPLAMAGIMGGITSAVQAHTQSVFLESAFFNPIKIAGVARKFGLFSDSSQRYERGVDPYIQVKALERATALILDIAGGEPGPIVESCNKQYLPQSHTFSFDTKKVAKLTGLDISIAEMKKLLEGLGILVLEAPNQQFEVQIPSHRFDLQQDVDLVEEIIRLYGYDHLKAKPMVSQIQAGYCCENAALAAKLSSWFYARGYHETISYSFVDPEIQEALYPQQEFIQLLNPISSELSQMRVGMWPGLIASMIYNIHRQQNAIRFFEVGVIFDVKNQEVKEMPCIAGLLTGERGSLSWNEATRNFDFYDLKGDLQALFATLKLKEVDFVVSHHDALHPGQTAQIMIGGRPAGWIGALHPKLLDALNLTSDVLLFELHLESLSTEDAIRYKSISKYPQIRRDLSFLVAQEVNVQQIEALIRSEIKEDWLKSFDVFDIYMGQGIPEGKKSIAFALTLQSDNRTLVDSEINLLISAIIKGLEKEFSIILRE